jgi:tRNA(Ile)-lysidine synthase
MPEKRPSKPKKKAAPVRRRSLKKSSYPVPGDTGGRLIRTVIQALRRQGFALPLTSHILCACSGGADSTALAVLLARYGRRVGKPPSLTLIHVNHGWRGKESDGDERFVRNLAKRLGVGFRVHSVSEKPKSGESWEAHARGIRKAFFREASREFGSAPVFTAHTADDQAETRIWRFLTGAYEKLGAGILPRHEVEVRPLLGVRRETLRAFLREERQTWREDSSNRDLRFLRARMRKDLMPVIEALFPRAVEAIIAENARTKVTEDPL